MIELYMKNANGVKARVVAFSSGWDALDPADVEAAKQFEPHEYCEIVLFREDGSVYRHGCFVADRP